MVERFLKQRISHLTAVYVEQDRVEVLTAHRQWRVWHIDHVDRMAIGEGEAVFDALARLSLMGRGRKNSALLVLLPLEYYGAHRAQYPGALLAQLDEALSFDWQENIFHDFENTLHFAGPPVVIAEHLSVPVFYLQKETYDKLHQSLSGDLFRSFAVLPAALCYKTFLSPEIALDSEGGSTHLVARLTGQSLLEVHRFYKGTLLDSTLLSPSSLGLRLFREKLRCLPDLDEDQEIPIHLIEDADSIEKRGDAGWVWDSLPIRVQAVRGRLIEHWIQHLFQQDEVRTFEEPIYLKPWEIPKVVWPVAAVAALYALFALFQVYSIGQLKETFQRTKKQTAILEAQWKPVEQLQTRIAKFQEDQKTLSQFNLEGYPLLELLTLITQITPDDTSLNYFSLRKGQVILRGESKSAIKYLPELSKVEGFADVKFASPVTRNPSSEQERFNVQFQLEMDKFRRSVEGIKLEVAMPPAAPSAAPPAAVSSDEAVEVEPQVEEDEDTEVTETDEEAVEEEGR